MKKTKCTILVVLLVLAILTACLVGCDTNDANTGDGDGDAGHTHSHQKMTSGSTFTMTCSCGDTLDGYRIQFIYAEDDSQAEAGINVTWTSQSGVTFSATTNALGYVEATSLTEDSYKISVDANTLPVIDGVEYLFNASNFKTQQNGVGLIIPLFGVHEPSSTTTIVVSDNDYDCDYIELNKTYFATLTSSSDVAWYNLQNNGVGKYTIDATLNEGLNVQMERYYGSVYYVNPNPDSKTDKTVQNKLTYTVICTDGTQNSLFCLSVSGASSYPVSIAFTVTITELIERSDLSQETLVAPTHFETTPCEYTYYTTERGSDELIPHTTNSLAPVNGTKCPDVEGSVITTLSEEQLPLMTLNSDGYYYTSDNQLVYAKLDTTSIFQELTLAGYLYDSAQFTIYTITERDEYGYLTQWDNYFGFVQAYTSLANSDGLYPLTDEMYTYLQWVATKEHQGVHLLLCTYPSQVASFTEGAGSDSNPYVLTLNEQNLGNYSVTIPANGKIYLTVSGTMEIALTFNSQIKATIDASRYIVGDPISVETSKTIIFEAEEATATALEFVLNVDNYDNPYYLEIGSNTVSAIPEARLGYEFIAPTTGSFDVSVTDPTVVVIVSPTDDFDDENAIQLDGALPFELEEGQSLFFFVTTGLSVETEFTIIIEQTPTNE